MLFCHIQHLLCIFEKLLNGPPPCVVDQPVYLTAKRIKPKRKLIVAFGNMLGLTGGIMLAYMVEFISRVRQQAVLKDA